MLLDDLGAGERRKGKEKPADIAGYETSARKSNILTNSIHFYL